MSCQLIVSMLGGAVFGLLMRRNPRRPVTAWTMLIFVVLPVILLAVALWPVLGTSYLGFPIGSARMITLIGLALSVLIFERSLVGSFYFLTRSKPEGDETEFSPPIGRRALILSGMGVRVAGRGVALLRKLY